MNIELVERISVCVCELSTWKDPKKKESPYNKYKLHQTNDTVTNMK